MKHAQPETSEAYDEPNSFVLSCFRALGPAPVAECPLNAMRDWRSATYALERHGLLPILGVLAANPSATSSLPSSVQQLALRAKLRLALYQANTLAALAEVDREMKAAGIPYAVLKGTYLYELLYRDLFPREYGDIDLLVPADRIEDAIPALKKAGYHGASTMPRWHFHATLTSDKPGGLPMELHRSLVDKANLYRVHDKDVFARLREFKAREKSFTVLSVEDELIYLCLHAAKHGVLNSAGLHSGFAAEWFCRQSTGNRLIWFLDIQLFLSKEKDNIDWNAVSVRVREWNVSEDVVNCLQVLELLQPSSLAGYAMERLGYGSSSLPNRPRPARRQGVLSRILQSGTGQLLLERSMQANPMFLIRPIRCLLAWQLLVPSPTRLMAYYGAESRLSLPWLYFIHPFHIIRKMLSQ